ncbi:MAG: flagellum-specific ATP synthase FliI, partial [Pseudomonadota bacterium]
MIDYESAIAEIGELSATRVAGAVASLGEGAYRISGLGALARVGDGVRVETAGGASIAGEVVAQERVAGEVQAVAMAFGPLAGAGVGDRVWLEPHPEPRPCDGWLGRTLDAFGRPVAGGAAPKGPRAAALRAAPPAAMRRRAIGARLSSGHGALDTLLPICRGQRLGVFAGSGVGKSRLMGALAQRMSADVVVIGLIGERGREVRDFVDRVLGPEAMRRAVVIAATSDQPAAVKRRAAWLTMATAEHFRDQGRHVLLLLDSLTRLADAHREVALTGGEAASMNGYPPSTLNVIAGLAERAGPGVDDAGPGAPVCGDVTAVFTVLVAGSDMEEPVADMTRGILDGHVVLSREIAERGR